LIAVRCKEDVENIRKELGVDSIHYLSLEKMLEVVPKGGGKNYCTACFGGKYPTPVESISDKNDLES
jgi:amidophosphoribosyltransferase